jgi:ABC-type sugar transport system ATPase subunit
MSTLDESTGIAQTRPILEIEGVTKRYHSVEVLRGVDLQIPERAFAVVVGPPASGKSVMLRILLGLEHADAGTIRLRGEDITRFPPADRNIGYVPQSFALYPHLDVYNNIAYPLKLAKVDRTEVEPIVTHAAEMLNIGDLLRKRPDQLSGGQKQRVAIARGIAKRTDVFVLDDPLAGLDFKLREQLVDDLRQLQVDTQATFLYSTSEAIEAMALADMIAVFESGTVAEVGVPESLYAHPQRLATNRLLGFPQANFLRGQLGAQDGRLWCWAGPFTFQASLENGAMPSDVIVGLRPEAIEMSAEPVSGGDRLSLPARVTLREDLGGEEIVYLRVEEEALVTVVRHDDEAGKQVDDATVLVDPRDLILFDADGQRIGQGALAHV